MVHTAQMRPFGTMARMDLDFRPALDHLDLLGGPVAKALADWPYADQVLVAEIDPELADTAAMSEAYGFSMLDSANCVVVSGKRAGEERVAACMVRADTRADVSKASFHPMDRAVEESGMEYGGITPFGIPAEWRLLVDERVTAIERACVGSGVRRSKLFLPGALLAELPGAEVVTDLAG